MHDISLELQIRVRAPRIPSLNKSQTQVVVAVGDAAEVGLLCVGCVVAVCGLVTLPCAGSFLPPPFPPQLEAIALVERAFVHVDYQKRDQPEVGKEGVEWERGGGKGGGCQSEGVRAVKVARGWRQWLW